MTQLNVIHEVGDSQDELSSSGEESESLTDKANPGEVEDGQGDGTDTDTCFFPRSTLW